MGHRILRKVVLPAILCANLAFLPVPAVGQSGGQPDSADRVASELADDLVGKMRDHRIPSRFQQRHAARLNSSVHHFRL